MLEISCAFATSLATPAHIAIAERLGYKRACCYDSPPLSPYESVPFGRPRGPGIHCTAQRPFGTVWDNGGEPGSQRGLAPAGHGAAVAFHALYERTGDVDALPGGREGLARLQALPAATRHLTVHDG